MSLRECVYVCKKCAHSGNRRGKQVVAAVGMIGKGMMFGASEFAFYRKILWCTLLRPARAVFPNHMCDGGGGACDVCDSWCVRWLNVRMRLPTYACRARGCVANHMHKREGAM